MFPLPIQVVFRRVRGIARGDIRIVEVDGRVPSVCPPLQRHRYVRQVAVVVVPEPVGPSRRKDHPKITVPTVVSRVAHDSVLNTRHLEQLRLLRQ